MDVSNHSQHTERPGSAKGLQWSCFKGVLKQKYIYENLTLYQVKTYMSSIHQFEASTGQYQRAFKKWGFRKNLKRREAEEIVVSAKKMKLDYGHLDFNCLPATVRSRLERALRHYDTPGLIYRKALDNSPCEEAGILNLKNQDLPLRLSLRDMYTGNRGLVRMEQKTSLGIPHMDTLPIILFTKCMQEELNLSIWKTRAGIEIMFPWTPSRSSLESTSTSSRDQKSDFEILLFHQSLANLEFAVAAMVYQISNHLLNGHKVSQVLESLLRLSLDPLKSIFASHLQTACAFSQRILAVLFEDLLLVDGPSPTFWSVLNLLLQTGIDTNIPVYGIDPSNKDRLRKVTLLQQSLALGHLDVAVRLVQANANLQYCAEHEESSNLNQMSCCDMHPFILLTETHFKNGWGENEKSINDLLKIVENLDIAYIKDISMTNLTDQHVIMNSLLAHDVDPDIMTLLSDGARTSKVGQWYTALQSSVDRCDAEAMSMLLRAGSNPNGCSFESAYNQLRARDRCRGEGKSETELEAIAYHTLAGTSAVTPLSIACSKPTLEMAKLLLQSGALVNGCHLDSSCKRIRSCESVDTAYYECHKDCGQHNPVVHTVDDGLVALDQRSERRGDLLSSPLHSRKDYTDPWNFEPVLGCAALQIAVIALNQETVEFLLSRGADIEGCHGLTPLALAAYMRSELLIRTLLRYGADPFGLTQYGPHISAVTVAAIYDDCHLLDVLLDNVSQQISRRPGASFSPWLAARRYRSDKAYHSLCTVERHAQLTQGHDDKIDFLIAALYFEKRNSNFLRNSIRRYVPEMCQTDKQIILQHCISYGKSAMFWAVLDSGADANDAGVLLFALLKTYRSQREPLDLLLTDSAGVTSTTALGAINKLHNLVFETRRTGYLRFSIGKLLERWPRMRPAPNGYDIYKMLELLLSDTFTKRPAKVSDLVSVDENVLDLALSLLCTTNKYSESRTSEYNKTPVQSAADEGRIDIVQALVQRGANINATAARIENWREFVERRELVVTETLPKTSLQYAVENSDIHMVNYLLDHGADVNAPGTAMIGHTALQIAVQQSDEAMVMLLLNRGANIDEPGCEYFGRSALQFAVEYENIDMVRLLLEAGADVNGPCSKYFGQSALQIAVSENNSDIFRVLLENRANVNQPGAPFFGGTALQLASEVGNSGFVQDLLNSGADVNWPAGHFGGVTALQAAAIRGSFHMCQLLVNAGADVNADAGDVEGRTAIEGAAEHGRLDILKWLLDLSMEQYDQHGEDTENTKFLATIDSAARLAYANNKQHIGRFLNAYASDMIQKMKMRPEASRSSERISEPVQPTQQEIGPFTTHSLNLATWPEAFSDLEVLSDLDGVPADTSCQFSDLFEEFMDIDMFE